MEITAVQVGLAGGIITIAGALFRVSRNVVTRDDLDAVNRRIDQHMADSEKDDDRMIDEMNRRFDEVNDQLREFRAVLMRAPD